jgi:hypothetical protein
LISGPGPARIMHYIFCIVFQPYKVFGGIYYIDRVSTWEGDGPSRRKCQFWQTKENHPTQENFIEDLKKKHYFVYLFLNPHFYYKNILFWKEIFISIIQPIFWVSFLACFNTTMCSWSNFEGEKNNCLSTCPPLKLWIRIQQNQLFF